MLIPCTCWTKCVHPPTHWIYKCSILFATHIAAYAILCHFQSLLFQIFATLLLVGTFKCFVVLVLLWSALNQSKMGCSCNPYYYYYVLLAANALKKNWTRKEMVIGYLIYYALSEILPTLKSQLWKKEISCKMPLDGSTILNHGHTCLPYLQSLPSPRTCEYAMTGLSAQTLGKFELCKVWYKSPFQ